MWIIFDVNGVITPNIELSIINDYAKKTKKNRIISFLRYLWLLLDYQKGLIDDKVFWEFVFDKNAYDYVKERYSKNKFLDEKIISEIKLLKKNKLNIAILSNSSFLMSQEYKKLKFYSLADKVFLSDEIHMIKPEPRIYKFVMKELKIKPKDCMLIDDSWYNVLSSVLMGWKVVWFRDVDDLSKILKKINKKEYLQELITKIQDKQIPAKVKSIPKKAREFPKKVKSIPSKAKKLPKKIKFDIKK